MKIALGLEYDGTRYFGWQSQEEVPSVQHTLELAIAKVVSHPVTVHCAGRTDRGVHATQQVIHFETDVERVDRAWTLGVNRYLPADIRVVWFKPVPDAFHARFSATARRYYYLIANQAHAPALWHHRAAWHYYPLDVEKMHQGLQSLIGEYDFSSFRAAGCQAKHGIRELLTARVWRQQSLVMVEVQANAFLHHMVRNIIGALLLVGEGKQSPEWIAQLRDMRDRTQGGVTAPPQGLYLAQVLYPDYDIPQQSRLPFWGMNDE